MQVIQGKGTTASEEMKTSEGFELRNKTINKI